MNYVDCKVESNRPIEQFYGRVIVHAPEIARTALPGQFVMVKCWEGCVPFFLRPFSLNSVDAAKGTIEILYKVIGEGTELLQKLEAGADMKVLGPLGNSFPLKDGMKRIAIIGRGVGAAPMRFLAEEAMRRQIDIRVFISASKPEYLFDEPYYRASGCDFTGSCDDKQVITSFFEEQLKKEHFDAAYTCGSKRLIMDLKRLMDVYHFEGYASLEEHMACGIGACKGCVCTTFKNGKEQYARVCKEGPIFPIQELVSFNV